MLKKFAAVLIAASMITAPALAQEGNGAGEAHRSGHGQGAGSQGF